MRYLYNFYICEYLVYYIRQRKCISAGTKYYLPMHLINCLLEVSVTINLIPIMLLGLQKLKGLIVIANRLFIRKPYYRFIDIYVEYWF